MTGALKTGKELKTEEEDVRDRHGHREYAAA